MDLSYILVWFIGLGCAAVLWSAWRQRTRMAMGRALWAGVVLGLMLGLYAVRPDLAGFVGLALFFLLILLPGWGYDWLFMAAGAGRTLLTRLLMLWMRLMHPFLDWRALHKEVQVEEMLATGRTVQAQQLMQQQMDGRTESGVVAAMRLFRLNDDWRGARRWLDAHVDPAFYAQNSEVLCQRLRVLGELGELDEMVTFFAGHQQAYVHSHRWPGWTVMMMLAFAGRPAAVSDLEQHPRLRMPPVMSGFWVATAYLAAGDVATGREKLAALPETDNALLRQSIQHRQTQGVAALGTTMSPGAQAFLEQVLLRLNQEAVAQGEVPQPEAAPRPRPVITLLLIVVNGLVFLLEISQGGTQNALTLYTMGALSPIAILHGEWWRLLTSMFLHAGIIHLLLNMYILYRVGGFMEYALGAGRYLLLYLLSGLGAGLLLVGLAVVGLEEMSLLAVGASGAIMGLIGAEAALWIKVYRQTGARIALSQLRSLGLFFVIQTVFDLSTPQVSFPAHFGGLVGGFLLGSLLQTGRDAPWLERLPRSRPEEGL